MQKLLSIVFFLSINASLFSQKSTLPHLEKKGNVTQLIVQGKPFLVLGGELHNSSTSGAAYMRSIWAEMKKKNLNTVIAPVYWELMEPQEGTFDFSLVDSMIYGARKQNLHLVILWFGSWKNGYSMYVPAWVKNDLAKFPRAKSEKGQSYAIVSALGEASMKADAKAFKMLMKHIREVDEKYQTVITVQIENEAGLFSTPRDFNELANKAYITGVPDNLVKYLTANKGKLQPELDSAWKANGYRTSGSWEEVFGKSTIDKKNWNSLSYLPEELFTVYHYSKYMGEVAAAGKEAYPIPMFVNAWIKQPRAGWPGKYPNGGPVPHTLDIWRANAPAIDFIAPDIYVPQKVAKYTIEQYNRSGNPVFIPEYRTGLQSASEAFWAYGEQDAICFSPFGIDDTHPDEDPITKTYGVLSQAKELILEHRGKETMTGFYIDTAESSTTFEMGGYTVKADLAGFSIAAVAGFTATEKPATMAGGIVINIGPDEFIAIGKDYRLSFTPNDPHTNKPLIDVEYMDEGTFVNGKWVTTRRLNGDEGTGGGDYGFGFSTNKAGILKFQKQPDGRCSIIRFKMYHF